MQSRRRADPGNPGHTAFAITLALCVAVGSSLGCASSRTSDEAPKERKRTVLLTASDDIRAGAEAAESVEAEIGLLDDPKLQTYVETLGKQLLRGLPRRDFAYSFSIIDQMEPNAFALPGGHIYVSRGLLALINNVDELACVLGHEIVHAARRHAAQQQSVARYQSPLSLPMSRAATLAAYGRDMEREADTLGQRLCAAAGYDPMALSTFLRSLDKRERLLIGAPRVPTFFDTHPGSRERAATNSARATELRWTRNPEFGDVRAAHLDRIDGMTIGDRIETGVFIDEVFVHPALGFEMTFPKGWLLQNSSQAVGALEPRRAAAVYLTGDLPAGELTKTADEFAQKASKDFGVRVTEKKRVRLGSIEALRYTFEGGSGGRGISAKMTFFPFAEANWRIVGVAPLAAGNRYDPPILLAMRSFGPISDAHRANIEIKQLRIVLAHRGEDIVRLGQRTQNVLDPAATALLNGLYGNEVFEGGESIKIVRRAEVDTR